MLTAPAASSAASLAGASTRAGPMVGTAATAAAAAAAAAAATAITPHTFGRGLMLAEASVGFAASTSLKGSSKHYPIVQHSLVSWLNRRDMSLSIMRAAALQFSPKLQQWSDEVKVRRSARAGGGGGGGGASPHTPVASRCRADGSRTLRCDGMPCHRRTHSSRAPSPLSLSLLRAPARLPPAPAAQRQTEEAEANDTEPPPLPPFPDVTAILPVVTKVVLREWTTVTLRRVFERVAERILRPELAWKLTKVRALVRCVGVGTAVRPARATRDCSDAVSPRRTSAHQPCARRRALAAGVA